VTKIFEHTAAENASYIYCDCFTVLFEFFTLSDVLYLDEIAL